MRLSGQVITSTDRKLTAWQRLTVVALMLIFFAQAVAAIPQLSLTADEPVYIGAGYAFLKTRDLRLATQAQHPPLMQELVALPLLLQPGPNLETLEGWDTAEMGRFARAFVAWYGDTLDAATFAARIPVTWIALLWGAFLFRWATDWFGPWGGIVALTLFAFDPNILAHATLATNDVGFAAFSFIALFAAARLLHHPSPFYLILSGLALGATLSAKSAGFFTVIVLGVLLPLAALVDGRKEYTHRVAVAVLRFAFIASVGLLVLWASYGFELRPLTEDGFPIPMATQWEVWREMRAHLAGGHTGYLMGEVRDSGWLAYYPVAFAIKTPPATIALLAAGLALTLASGPRLWLDTLPLWVYVGGYVAATLMSTVSTGYRFLLPVLPFCFILIAGLFPSRLKYRVPPILLYTALLIGYAIGAARIHPHYLTYFNLFAGGPTGGHRYLVDSNLDWGQSFKALKLYLSRQNIERVHLSYYTYTDPALYGIDYQPIAPSPDAPPTFSSHLDPAPGFYVIGATPLQGVMVVDPDMYDWFRHREPIARPGNALFVYHVLPREEQPAWLAQCVEPVPPLSTEKARKGLGQTDLRLVYFDCVAGWLYPGGGQSPGWYALHRDTTQHEDSFIQRHLSESSLSYEKRRSGETPPFVLYEQSSPLTLPSHPSRLPVKVDYLTFLGHTVNSPTPIRPGQRVEIETWWQVDRLPERPLSIMLHLVGPAGTPIIVGDGLGVPISQWQIGDIIIQRHSLPLPEEGSAGEYIPITGVYWLDTMEQWPVQEDGKPVGDQLTLPAINLPAE